MSGEKDLPILLQSMKPILQEGDFVFCSVDDASIIDTPDIIMSFKEKEGITIIIKKELANDLQLPYSFIASWITLSVHSSLDAVGLTSAVSSALANANISCNVVAAYYHDHIFVPKKDAAKAIEILKKLSRATPNNFQNNLSQP